jgi:hypothetical protein
MFFTMCKNNNLPSFNTIIPCQIPNQLYIWKDIEFFKKKILKKKKQKNHEGKLGDSYINLFIFLSNKGRQSIHFTPNETMKDF